MPQSETNPSLGQFHDAPGLRGESELQSQTPRWWFGYAATPGLEKYRQDERYSVWQHTHERCLKTSVPYARGTTRFHAMLLAAAAFGMLMQWVIGGAASTGQAFLLASAGSIALGWLVLKQEQARRNAAIATALSQGL